jgi:glycosyltransferase involved in cell wall biosynthesis
LEKAGGVGLIILGEGPERRRLEKIIGGSAPGRVQLPGYREPMAPIFKACDLFLLTSTSEGLNSSAIEAAACGLPLVVSNVGGLPEIAEQEYNGILCPPGRPEIFAEAILNLVQDDEKRRRMAENSARKSEKFDIASATSQIVDFYKSLLAE